MTRRPTAADLDALEDAQRREAQSDAEYAALLANQPSARILLGALDAVTDLLEHPTSCREGRCAACAREGELDRQEERPDDDYAG